MFKIKQLTKQQMRRTNNEQKNNQNKKKNPIKFCKETEQWIKKFGQMTFSPWGIP